MFPGKVCSFIWTTVTSALKRALRCFGHHLQSKKWWTIYFGSVFSLAPIGSARGRGLEAPLTGGFLAWVESCLLGTLPSDCHSVSLYTTCGWSLCLPHLVSSFHGTVHAWSHAKTLPSALLESLETAYQVLCPCYLISTHCLAFTPAYWY